MVLKKMAINKRQMTKYAKLMLGAAALHEGDCLFIRAEPVHWDFINILTEEAYRAGAKYVHTESQHKGQLQKRIQNSSPEDLDYLPEFHRKRYEEIIRDKWTLISVFGEENPDLLKGLDPGKVARITKAVSEQRKPFLKAIQNNELSWLVAAFPTPRWAAKVLETDPSEAARDELWDILIPILHLEKDDPLTDWTNYTELLKERSNKLNKLRLRRLHFKGPGTDLSIHIPEKALWAGGPDYAQDGRRFMPNIPTQEVYTLPDFRKTEGTVKLTMPVRIMEEMVRGGTLTFREGKATAFDADEGKEALKRYLELDDSVRYIGEIALVDSNSPIYQSGKVFYSTLLDENAACHIALGSAYPSCLEGGSEMSEDELSRNGANVSPHHTDIMIGSPDVNVTGTTREGKEIPLIREGAFKI